MSKETKHGIRIVLCNELRPISNTLTCGAWDRTVSLCGITTRFSPRNRMSVQERLSPYGNIGCIFLSVDKNKYETITTQFDIVLKIRR